MANNYVTVIVCAVRILLDEIRALCQQTNYGIIYLSDKLTFRTGNQLILWAVAHHLNLPEHDRRTVNSYLQAAANRVNRYQSDPCLVTTVHIELSVKVR